MKYRLTRVSDTMYRVTLGRETIGWTRKFDTQWVATTRLGNGQGPTASEAFRDMVRSRNNHQAQQAGYRDAQDMVDQRNAEVRAHVERVNAELGFRALKVRRRGRILV